MAGKSQNTGKATPKKVLGDALIEGEAVDPKSESVRSLASKQASTTEEAPFPLPDFSLVFPGWNRVSNTTVTQIAASEDSRGFRDKLIAEQKKSSFTYLVRFPRFAARQRNLWSVIKMSEEDKADLLNNRNRYSYELDKADFAERLKYMREVLKMDTSEFE